MTAPRESDRPLGSRRGLLAALLGAAGALAGAVWWGSRPDAADSRGYQEVARWPIPGGEGRFIAVAAEPAADDLRALGDRLRRELREIENAVVMVFDSPEAAREARRGSRVVGEARFQAAIAHQRAMYVKQPARGEHQLLIYDGYPGVREVVRY